MLGFLRKIRYKILTESKFLKYLKYAFGEIILVVIGILIAVAINSKYNEAQNDEKINRILFEIQRELLTDIQDSRRIFNEYIRKDSIYRMIMNDTSLVYLHQQSPFSFRINTNYVSFSTKKAGYNRLLNNIEVIPEDYNSLLTRLNYLHVELQNDIDDYNVMIKKAVLGYFEKENANHPEFSELFWENDTVKTLQYFVNDPFYKNKLTNYMNGLRNIQQVANDYRIESIAIYNTIDSLNGKTTAPNALINSIPLKTDYKDFLGEYTAGSNTLTLSENGDNLLLNGEKLYWHEKHYYYNKNSYNIIRFYQSGGQYLIEILNANNEQYYKKTDN